MKRIIVCGGRDFADYTLVWDTLNLLCPPELATTIVHGAAPGADALVDAVAGSLGLSVDPHPAEWKRWGLSAGPRRNEEMARIGADLCVAFPGGRGTADMVARAQAHAIPVVRVR